MYEAVIGLEVHAQLKTRSKLFCSCSTAFGQGPNTNICPVCTGMPGALPVVNKRAVEFAVKMALAVGCTVNEHSVFARKNYFYPDLPKGYQISQYECPLAEHGELTIQVGEGSRTIGIIRIHMEDDAGKSIHSSLENMSFVDLNRTGVPLIEIVSSPDLRSPDEAVAYLKALRNILIYLGICDGNMEEGNFRCDANVSIRPRGETEFGTRTELKNMNSFRHVHRALSYEIQRQEDLLQDGEAVVQETRLYDDEKGITRTMRGKEEAHDYRYFPDPDLVPLQVSPDDIRQWEEDLPELPLARLQRFAKDYGLPAEQARILTEERDLADYFEAVVAHCDQPKTAAHWMSSEMIRELREMQVSAAECPMPAEHFAALLKLIQEGTISTKIGKQIFPEVFREARDPEAYVQDKGFVQISDQAELESVVAEVLAENPDEVQAFKGGKKKLVSFFMGQVMKKTKGQANPKLVNELLTRQLQNDE